MPPDVQKKGQGVAETCQKAGERYERGVLAQGRRGKEEISAPLIIDPTAGALTGALKSACNKYYEATGVQVTVCLRAGFSVGSDAKSEPLRQKSCGRDNCLCCSTGHPGGCETNSVGYRITCESCQGAGSWAQYEGESGRNAFSQGLEHQEDLRN